MRNVKFLERDVRNGPSFLQHTSFMITTWTTRVLIDSRSYIIIYFMNGYVERVISNQLQWAIPRYGTLICYPSLITNTTISHKIY